MFLLNVRVHIPATSLQNRQIQGLSLRQEIQSPMIVLRHILNLNERMEQAPFHLFR